MSKPSNIFHILGSHILAECGVCSAKVVLRWHDVSTGIKVGNCCANQLIAADRCLTSVRHFGLRHPIAPDQQNPAWNR